MSVSTWRCELLSKVDIFDIRNNAGWWINRSETVVNCSQKLISLIFGTTLATYIENKSWL